jgi:hypothetical protein
MAELSNSEFVCGAQAMREMLARFVEQGGDKVTAQSMRLNWDPAWGNDPGPAPAGRFTVIRFDADGLKALHAANIDGRFNNAIAEAEKMQANPALTFTPDDTTQAQRVTTEPWTYKGDFA